MMGSIRSYLVLFALLVFTLREDDHDSLITSLFKNHIGGDEEIQPVSTFTSCNVSESESALSALTRAKTHVCKRNIEYLLCEHANLGKLAAKGNYQSEFYKLRLQRDAKCSRIGGRSQSSTYLACVQENDLIANSNETLRQIVDIRELDVNFCKDVCLRYHKYAAWRSEPGTKQCVCFDKELFDQLKSSSLIFDENACERAAATPNTYFVYKTGHISYSGESKKAGKYLLANKTMQAIRDEYNSRIAMSTATHNELPRVVFLFTLNGRSIRQVTRLIKTIYNEYHFYYIHVDKRMTFLRRELLRIQDQFHARKLYNVRVTDWAIPTLWGSPTLLQMHLSAMKDLQEMKSNGFKCSDGRVRKWNWDFLYNLSESDFPIKSLEELTLYLQQNRQHNFLKFHSKPEPFAKRQGLEYAFLQCEEHIWKVTERILPYGVQYGGGSDWFCLTFDFIDYILSSNDEYLDVLKRVFQYTLLPSEAFFHVVLLNSPFCDKFLNTNLKFINWIRSRGCGCPNREIVDWCGCSPNFIANSQWESLEAVRNKPFFFARKFDPMFSSQMLNRVDQSIFGLYSTEIKSLNSYWENVFDRPKFETEIANIPTKYRVLFEYFAAQSFEILKSRLVALNRIDLRKSVSDFLAARKGSLLNHVVQVNAFFQADNFKGFVVEVDFRLDESESINFEVYFVPAPKEIHTSVHSNSSDQSKTAKRAERVLQSIISLQVSTNYNAKEQQFRTNYASIMDKFDHPALLMELDPLQQDIKLSLKLFDPAGTWIKQTNFNLNKSSENRLILSQLFSGNSTLATIAEGVWTIELGVLSDLEENEAESKYRSLLSHKFLVIPETGPNGGESPLAEFWKVRSFCVKKFSQSDASFLFNEMLPSCETDSSYWSTSYSDPKSNIFDPITIRSHRLN